MTVLINKSMNAREWAILLCLSMVWGFSYFLVSVALKDFHPLSIVTLRIAFAAILLLILLRVKNLSLPKDKTLWFAFFGIGLLTNLIPFCLLAWGQTYIASGLASILVATTPIFTVLIAHVLTHDEKITVSRLAGAILGVAGVIVMTGTEVLHGMSAQVLAELACLLASLCYAFGGIYGRRFKTNGITPLVAVTGQLVTSACLLLPALLIYKAPRTSAIPSFSDIPELIRTLLLVMWTKSFAAILCLAIFSTALAFVLYFKLLSTAGATNAVLVTLLIPVSAILLGTWILNEVLLLKHYLGTALIGFGLLVLDGRLYMMARSTLNLQVKQW